MVEQLAAAQQTCAVVQALAVGHLVATPGQVNRPDLSRSEAEAGVPCEQDMCRIQASPARANLSRVHTHRERPALRNPLHTVPSSEIEKLVRLCRDRNR